MTKFINFEAKRTAFFEVFVFSLVSMVLLFADLDFSGAFHEKGKNLKLSLGKHSRICYYKIEEILKRADESIVLWWHGVCLSALRSTIKKASIHVLPKFKS